jgi:hypothetical protein
MTWVPAFPRAGWLSAVIKRAFVRRFITRKEHADTS